MESPATTAQNRWFVTTRWSVVLRAGDDSTESREALEQLCRAYWYPVFTFARSTGRSREEAEDLAQGFFTQLLERRSLQNISRVGGKFRSFLLVAFKNYAANQFAREQAQKRGGGVRHLTFEEPECAPLIDAALKDKVSPDRLFDQAWALLVIDRAQSFLCDEYKSNGKEAVYIKLVQFLPGESVEESQADAAKTLGMKHSAFRMELLRFKQRLADRIRADVTETVGPDGDVDLEVKNLMESFAD